mmetsp:Transcript_8490/g.14846  ORF Transcript_8490/g.14846 Transcript_8490/m.14846 type:complete len:109 (+) Transcript_8490:106-432(+)
MWASIVILTSTVQWRTHLKIKMHGDSATATIATLASPVIVDREGKSQCSGRASVIGLGKGTTNGVFISLLKSPNLSADALLKPHHKIGTQSNQVTAVWFWSDHAMHYW